MLLRPRLSRGLLLSGVVAAAGTDLEILVAGCFSGHLDRTVAALALRRRRLVPNGVLIANVVRDLGGDLLHLVQVLREVGDAAGAFGHLAQGAPRALGVFISK